MTELPQQPNDDDIRAVFDRIIVDLDDQDRSEVTRTADEFFDQLDSNLAEISLFATQAYETEAPIPKIDIGTLQANETAVFAAAVAAVMKESNDITNKIKTIAGTFSHATQSRSQLFNKLMSMDEDDDDRVIAWDREFLETRITSMLSEVDGEDDLVTKITEFYFEDLVEDCNSLEVELTLIAKSRKSKQETQQAQQTKPALLAQKNTKDHLVDVAKISIGVLGALALDRILWRRRT